MTTTLPPSQHGETMSSKALAKTWPYPHQYKYVVELRGAALRWFNRRGLRTHAKYPYSLQEWTQWPQNIILPEVVAYIQERSAQSLGKVAFALHKHLHNGLSSQAMLFNLIGPLIVREDLSPLQVAFGRAGVPWPEGRLQPQLEDTDRSVFNEDTGQPTSIDLALYGEGGSPLFIEAKFTEVGFGGCSTFENGDCTGQNPEPDLSTCYLHHIGRTYWVRALEQGWGSSALAQGPICPFTVYYQFFRESLYAVAKQGHFVLLYDERSPVFVRSTLHKAGPPGLWTFLTQQAPPSVRARLHAVTIQAVVEAIEASGRHDDWIGVFKEKYGLE